MSRSKKNRKSSSNKGNNHRRLFVIDVENFCGKPKLTEEDIKSAKAFFEKSYTPRTEDLVLIGTSHTSNFIRAGIIWKGSRQVFGKGHNGADLALIDAVKDYKVNSFEEIVIISGDGIFAETVDEIASQGVIVTVVSIARCLSKRLAEAAPFIRLVKNPLAA